MRDFKLPAGTVLSVQLRTPINSGVSRVDEPVTAELRESVTRDSVELIPVGSVMFGKVAEVTSAAPRNLLGRIVLAFHVIEHAETGHRAMIASRLVAFEAVVPEPPEAAPRRRKAKKEPIDAELPVGQAFTVTLAEPLLIRIPG